MADLFGGLGGFMKGLSSFMPQDDPDTKIFNANNELNELKQRELQLYAEIGKKVISDVGSRPEFSDIVSELQENQRRQIKIKETLKTAEDEKKEKQRIEQEERKALTCPNCDYVNPEGVKFCQECGTKLGAPGKGTCPGCGTKNPPESRFCGECGHKLL